MERSWLIDCKGIASKVKCTSLSPDHQLKDCGARRKCPKCHYTIDNSDVFQDWPGLPSGVKFDPSDLELVEHLAAKCGVGNSEPHIFIDEFIPTVEEEGGICYAHPEDLPGARKDGSSVHFFHRTMNAYASGQRKRRKIQKNQNNLTKEDVRWHKTGKTKSLMENGMHKGYKKIMVLYIIKKKGTRPVKANWIMHQYHLGIDEDEPEGQFVVSKIFYQQQRSNENNGKSDVIQCSDRDAIQTSPRTPKTATPNPPRSGVFTPNDDTADVYVPQSSVELSMKQEVELLKEAPHSSSVPKFNDDIETQTCLAGESQAIDDNGVDDSLLCNENFYSHLGLDDFGLTDGALNSFGHVINDISVTNRNANCGVSELDNLDFDTPPDFQLTDLAFGSQETMFSWLDSLKSNG